MEGEYTPSEVQIKTKKEPEHYHGKIIRELFFSAGFLMLIGLPFFYKNINFNAFIPVLGILVVNLLGGLTNPRQRFIIVFDIFVSLFGLAIFETLALYSFNSITSGINLYFWFNQLLAILFFIALYFSTKTFRGMTVKE